MSTARGSTSAQPTPARASRDAGPRRSGGPHLGPLRITPARVFLTLALVGGLAFLGYSILFRDALQVPLMATGFAVCGIVFLVAAFMAARSVVSAGRDGRDATAFFTSLLGGVLAVGGMGCIAAAVIMSMIWSGSTTG